MLGGGEVAGAPLLLRERLDGHVTDEILQEAVLTVLGRAWVGLEREHLLADERAEQRLEFLLGRARTPPPAAARVNVFPTIAAS